jgi:hypothetical protein
MKLGGFNEPLRSTRREALDDVGYSANRNVRDDIMVYKVLEMLIRWRLFRRARPPERTWDIIGCWESRRIPYNPIVGAAGSHPQLSC